ncbi:hypothetical protein JCM3775_001277 [Rhodotorula graminis]
MSSIVPARISSARGLLVAKEAIRTGLPPFVLEQHLQEHLIGTNVAVYFHLPAVIESFCNFFRAAGYVGPDSWYDEHGTERAPYHLDKGECTVVKGAGTADHPFVVVTRSYDERVRAVDIDYAFSRFQIAHPQRKFPNTHDMYMLAGPALILHDKARDNRNPTPTMTAFNATNRGTEPLTIDSRHLGTPGLCSEPDVSILPAGFNAHTMRVVWTFLRPDPSALPLQSIVADEHGTHHLWDQPGVASPSGFLPTGWGPAVEVTWALSIEMFDHTVDAVARQEAHFHIVFSSKHAETVAEVRRLLGQSAPSSLGKAPFVATQRGAERVQTLRRGSTA